MQFVGLEFEALNPVMFLLNPLVSGGPEKVVKRRRQQILIRSVVVFIF
jgi:hypothetical protein